MKEISSPDNPSVKRFAALYRKKERDRQGLYIIEGPNLLREALNNGAQLDTVFFRKSRAAEQRTEEYDELLKLLAQRRAEPKAVSGAGAGLGDGRWAVPEPICLSDGLFDRAAETETPQGVMAAVKKRRWSEDELFAYRAPNENGGGNVLVLDRLQDPGNLGTVLRTADGAGFSGAVLVKGCGDIYSPKVVRACTGTLFRLPVLFCETAEEALELLRRRGKKVYATSLEGSEVYYKCNLKENTALVIGNEGSGVCREFLEGADGLLTIPMAGNLESLNAAVAAGILMYETVRQRNGG